MDPSPGHVETDLLDLSDLSLAAVGRHDKAILHSALQRVLRQVERPRSNIGNNPPARVD